MSTAENPGILPPLGALLLGTHPLRRNDLEADTSALLPAALRDPRTRVLTLDAEGRAPIRCLPDPADAATADAAPAHDAAPARAEIAWAGTAQVSGPLAHLGLTADGAPVLLALPTAQTPGEASTATTSGTAAGAPSRRLGLREAAEMLDPEQTGWFTAGLALYLSLIHI